MAPRCITATVLLLSLAASARAEPDPKLIEDVKEAIKKGQDFLKNFKQAEDPNPELGLLADGVGCGPACLQGLALIESGLPTTDKVLVHLAQAARQVALKTYNTYEVSLLIMFFDRYGAKEDAPFIQFLTLRLMSGQTSAGAWSYQCMGLKLDDVQERMLFGEFTKGARLVTPAAPKTPKPEPKPRTDIPVDPPAPKKEAPPAPKKDPKPTDGLHPIIKEIQKGTRPAPDLPPPLLALPGGDHSNTQFATVALWCGRRHHVDVSDALAKLDQHYRKCQNSNGGWGYTAESGTSPAMTCAGLMGLAMGFGGKSKGTSDKPLKIEEDTLQKDRQVSAGLKHLGDYLAAAAAIPAPAGQRFAASELSDNLYFMWSLERVGMVYGLTTIGKIDWYDWGARLLVRSQAGNGSWPGNGFHGASPQVSTAFALLFLSRANLAQDLASSMKGKVTDPGTSSLKSAKDLDAMLGQADKGSAGTKRDPKPTTPKAATPKADPPAAKADPARDPKSGPTAAELAKRAKKLAAELVAAEGAERTALLKQYQESKGLEFTDALVLAIGQLTGDPQAEARLALATRMQRMNAETLNLLMGNEEKELRAAAALATSAKGPARLAEFANGLIQLIADSEPLVVDAAHSSLKALSGKDFGPETGASAGDRTKALQAWREWWKAEPK